MSTPLFEGKLVTKVTAKELLDRLQRHYIKPGDLLPGGVFMPEVTLGNRRADALYVGFWQSRGRHLVGHEIKVARADWLHELDQPEKAEAWEPNCHAWYVVAPSMDIVRPEELPEGWGLMVPGKSKTRMHIVVKARVHEDRQPSWDATHALVQRADSLRAKAIEEDRRKTREQMWAEIDERVEQRVASATGDAQLQRDADRMREQMTALQEILGLKVTEGGWKDNHVTVEEIRSSFARWLAADKDVQRAIGRRDHELSHAARQIANAQDALATVRGVS